MKPKIYLIDGHTLPKDYGAQLPYPEWNNLWNEAKLVRVVSNKIYELINNSSRKPLFDIIYFNVDNKNLNESLFRKVQAINYTYSDKEKDLAIEIHFDFVSNQNANGRSVIVGSAIEAGKIFKSAFNIPEIKNNDIYVIEEYWKNEYTTDSDLAILKRDLGFISDTKIKAIIVENLFVSSKKDMSWIFSDLEGNSKKLAQTVVDGIFNYYEKIFGIK